MELRGAMMADVDAVVAMVRAAEQHDCGEAFTTRGDLASDWRRPGMDIATDVAVIEVDGQIVAEAEQYHGRAFVNVHPDARGGGIGTTLAAWTEAHARAAGLSRVGQTIPTGADDAVALLTGRGYAPLWESWVFRRELADVEPEPELPSTVTVRGLRRPDDDAPLYDVIERAFSEWPERDPSMGLEDWRASMLDRDDVDDDLILVLEADGELVGAAVCMVDGAEGWIEQLAVARERRGLGLGRALLQAAFHRFRARGLTAAGLSTDSRTGARALYERVGMQVTQSFTRYRLDLG